MVPSLEPAGAWVSSSRWLPSVPRPSRPVARAHAREEHAGGADLRARRGLGEGCRKAVWQPGIDQDGTLLDDVWVADITGLLDLSEWTEKTPGLRILAGLHASLGRNMAATIRNTR